MSSWSVLSVCNNVTGQPLLEYLQGNITVLATFSIARFLIFPAKKLRDNDKSVNINTNESVETIGDFEKQY
jgi:hypothetical protein